MTMRRLAPVFWILPLFFFSACDYFETKVPASEIQKATLWSAKDQYPSFMECDGETQDEQRQCFEEVLREAIGNALAYQGWIATEPTQGTLVLKLAIDKGGVISLLGFDDPDDLSTKISDLDTYLTNVVSQLPQALPATKTNVGSPVDVTLQLPIEIVASAE